jgi:hypothetical protein
MIDFCLTVGPFGESLREMTGVSYVKRFSAVPRTVATIISTFGRPPAMPTGERHFTSELVVHEVVPHVLEPMDAVADEA